MVNSNWASCVECGKEFIHDKASHLFFFIPLSSSSSSPDKTPQNDNDDDKEDDDDKDDKDVKDDKDDENDEDCWNSRGGGGETMQINSTL